MLANDSGDLFLPEECMPAAIQTPVRKLRASRRLTPEKIARQIRLCGYVGQERALRAVSLFAYRHLDRMERIRKGRTRHLPAKANMLLVGPTGCGKTHLVNLLFREILKVPTVMIDITSYTEAGYVGQDLNEILSRLLHAAKMDVGKAETGVVCLDEFDKIPMCASRQGKDLTGLGIQRELLKMVEGSRVSVPAEIGNKNDVKRIEISTVNIPFIACGAFSGLKGIIHGGRGNAVGFLRESRPAGERIAEGYTEEEVNLTGAFQRYGYLPELIGRFSRIVPFEALGPEEIRRILKQNVVTGWREEMSVHEIDMVVDDSLFDYVVDIALKRETGARSVEAVFSRLLEDAAYEAYSFTGARRLVLNLDQGRPGYRIEAR